VTRLDGRFGRCRHRRREYRRQLVFDCSSADIVLRNVSAPTVVIRSGHLESLTLFSSNIDRLVFAAGSGDLNFSPTAGNTVGTAAVGTGSGKITLGGRISNIEITGDNRMSS
jgi:hypothetical protein